MLTGTQTHTDMDSQTGAVNTAAALLVWGLLSSFKNVCQKSPKTKPAIKNNLN